MNRNNTQGNHQSGWPIRSDDRFDPADFKSTIFRCAFAGLLFIVAAVLFFACREDGGSIRDPGDLEKNSPALSNEPGSLRTDGRRQDTFSHGTVINGIDVGGLSEDEARIRLSGEIDRLFSEYECKLRYKDRIFILNKSDISLESNEDEVLKKALRSGGEHELEVRPMNERRLKDAIDRIAETVDSVPKNAELLSAASAEGLKADETARNSRFIVTAPVDGVSVKREKTAELILAGAKEAELPTETIPADTEAPALPQRRAVFSTSFNSPALSASGRVHNIKKAAALLNARAIEPGKTLSCNEALGQRSKENGWQTATAFASGGRETEQQYGGGICQVSTTLYNCALMAGLDVPQRIGHSRKVAYIEGGRDAALSWGSADLVIKNSTDEAIYIFMWTDDEKNCLMCEIYGGDFPDGYDEIAVVSELIEITEPDDPEFIVDEALKEGDCVQIRSAIRGSVYETFLEYRNNGTPLRREPVSKTAYPMIPALYAVPGSNGDLSEGAKHS